MIIYTVKSGDTLFTIARSFGTTVNQIVYDNQIADPNKLVVGQALVMHSGRVTHTVARGDTLFRIAMMHGTTVNAILAANTWIANPNSIYPGQIIVIPRKTMREIDVNGFNQNLTTTARSETLPYLTYISPFSFGVDKSGTLTPINDAAVISEARNQSVAPLMCITNTDASGRFSSDIAHAVLTDMTAQNALIQNVMKALRERNYYGLCIDFEYVFPFDRENYNNFLRRIVQPLHNEGYLLSTALAPKTYSEQSGILYEAHDYAAHGEICDLVIIMTYEWGYTYGPAMAVSPIGPVKKVLDYGVSVIPPRKILMGMPNYGYDWTLPFVQGTAARVVTNVGAVNLAVRQNVEIKYDEVQQSPFFNYFYQGNLHEVWFDDARSVQARLRLVDEYNLGGISYWTIDSLFRQGLIVLQDMYKISKVI